MWLLKQLKAAANKITHTKNNQTILAHDYICTSHITHTYHTHISVEVRKQWFCLVQQRDGALSADVSGRQRFHLTREKQLPMLQLMLLLLGKVLLDRLHTILVIFFQTTCTRFNYIYVNYIILRYIYPAVSCFFIHSLSMWCNNVGVKTRNTKQHTLNCTNHHQELTRQTSN